MTTLLRDSNKKRKASIDALVAAAALDDSPLTQTNLASNSDENSSDEESFTPVQPAPKKTVKKAAKGPKLVLAPLGAPPTLVHGQYTSEQLRAVLAEREFVVILGVFTPEKVALYAELFRQDYKSIYDHNAPEEGAFNLDIDDVKTLDPKVIAPWKGSGIVNVKHVCGLRTLRDIRLEPECAEAFMKYYDVGAPHLLAKAPDRFSVHMPGKVLQGLEPHIDANATRPADALAQAQVQGVLVLRQSPYADQGFVIWPGHANNPGKWNAADEEGVRRAKDEPWCRVPVHLQHTLGTGYIINPPIGSLILWRSTAVHGNTSGKGKRDRVGRLAAYMAMYPWARISEASKAVIEKAWVTRITHGHDLVQPRKQTPGGFWMGTQGRKIDWRFGADRLTDYKSVSELPAGLRRPQ